MNLPVLPTHSDCTLCDLHITAKNIGIPTTLLHDSPDAEFLLLVIGQNPGFHEDQQGTPFVGRSGDMVRNGYLAGIHAYDNASIYLTNTARCYHEPLYDQPKESHYKACSSSHLPPDLHSLRSAHPSQRFLILCLGAPAVKSTYRLLLNRKVNLKEAFSMQGTPSTNTDLPPCHLFAAYHPAAVMRQNSLKYAVHDQLQHLANHLTDNVPVVTTPNIIPPRSPR